MVAWHRTWRGDAGLRLSGVCLCLIAYAALARLFAGRPSSATEVAGALTYALATIGFLSASAGAALTVFGHHLFDEIEVSARWHQRRIAPATQPADPHLAPAPWPSMAAGAGR